MSFAAVVRPSTETFVRVTLIVTLASQAVGVLLSEDGALVPRGLGTADVAFKIPDARTLLTDSRVFGSNADASGMRLRAQQHRDLPFNPMVVISLGCSGSSHIGMVLRRLLKMKGIKLYPLFRGKTKSWELTVPANNPEYTDHVGIPQAIRRMGERSANQNTTLVFKAYPIHMTHELATTVRELGGRAILYWRNNPLDFLVCQVRDCHNLEEEGSFPVNSEGERSHLCFKRRHSDQLIKAQLNVSHLATILRREQRFAHDMLQMMAQTDLPLTEDHVFDFDTLYGFEEAFYLSGDTGLQRSALAWRKILSIFGVELNSEEVEDALRLDIGKWRRKLHNETIFNIEEVAQNLHEERNADLLQYLRI